MPNFPPCRPPCLSFRAARSPVGRAGYQRPEKLGPRLVEKSREKRSSGSHQRPRGDGRHGCRAPNWVQCSPPGRGQQLRKATTLVVALSKRSKMAMISRLVSFCAFLTNSRLEPRAGEGKREVGREKGKSLISTVGEGKESRGHARKRLMQAA